MPTRSISEARRARYLLGLCSPAEREHIEREYFEDEDAFQEMLITEEDLIDAYARGELAGEERWRFEKSFLKASGGRVRVQFARGLVGAVSATRSVDTKLPGTWLHTLKTFQPLGLLRTATILTVFLVLSVFSWLVVDRRRMTNELNELRAESVEFSKRTAALQRSRETERTQTAEIAAPPADLRAQPDKPRQRARITSPTHRLRKVSELTTKGDKIAGNKTKQPERPTYKTAVLDARGSIKALFKLPLEVRNVPSLLTLQTATTRNGYVAWNRSDQTNITLDGIDLDEPLDVDLKSQNPTKTGCATVRGTVKDPQGNVMSNATVTLMDTTKNLTRTQSTNENGAYVFNAIPSGTYSIKITAPGFKTSSILDVAAIVDTPTVRDVQLEVGNISERVDVSAATPLVNRDDATLGNSFVAKRITELPLEARNVPGLLTLQTGVSRTEIENGKRDQSSITLDSLNTTIRIPNSLSWIRFQMALDRGANHENYRLTVKTAAGRPVTSIDWIEPLTPNQTIVDTPVIATGDVPSGNYVLLLMGQEPDGSFVKVAEYSFKVIKG